MLSTFRKKQTDIVIGIYKRINNSEVSRLRRLFLFKSVRTKIIVGFSVVLLGMLFTNTLNYVASKKTNESTRQMVENELELLVAYQQMAASMAIRISAVRGYLLSGNEAQKNTFDSYTKIGIENEQLIREIRDTPEFDELIKRTVNWRRNVDAQVFTVYEQGNQELAIANAVKLSEESTSIRQGYEELAKNNQAEIEQVGEKMIERGKRNNIFIMIIASTALVLGILIAILTARSISKPIISVSKRMKRIASGDISNAPMVPNTRDEVGQLMEATNEMSKNLHTMLEQISEVSHTVAAHSEELTQSSNEVKVGSEQVAYTMEELASGAETQAASAGELVSLMETFAVKVQESNEHGDQIAKVSEQVLAKTEEGRQLMDSSASQMERINYTVQEAVQQVEGLDAQSQEITSLVSVINTISDQTNLLALNAAIEAARAGEHGRGFSVVADEVRKLAEQVNLSVTDISTIVHRIQSETATVASLLQNGYREVEEGTESIRSTRETFTQISSSVNEMANNIQAVSDNMANLTKSSERIGQSIDNIASVSQEAAAGIEETAASVQQTASSMDEVATSSLQLAEQAEALNGLVGKFKL